jgi:hypothetical protein
MKDPSPAAVSAHFLEDTAPPTDRSLIRWYNQPYNPPLLVLVATLLLAATALARSFFDGRLANPLTHDDVNYFIEGIRHLATLRTSGFFAPFRDLIDGSLHAPLSTYQAMLAYLLFGVTDWAPYASNVVYAALLLGFVAYLLRDCPAIVAAAAMTCVISIPLSTYLVIDFAPELSCGLFTSIAVVLFLRLPLFGAPLRSRFVAASCFGMGTLAHPSAFAFTLVALFATTGLRFVRGVVLSRRFIKFGAGIRHSLVDLVLSMWLPALYMIPRSAEYWDYFYRAILNPTTRGLWGGTGMSIHEHLVFYLYGTGGRVMFGPSGDRLWICGGIIAAGIAMSWWRNDRRSTACLAELVALTLLFWLLPTLAFVKNQLFGTAFGFALIFVVVLSLRSIHQSVRPPVGVIVVLALATLVLVSDTFRMNVPNTPKTVMGREFNFDAIDRLESVLLGNATRPHTAKVYLSNEGGYAPNILQWYLLKRDPTLDWEFNYKWPSGDPAEHLDFINTTRPDFVVAGQRDNGFTYDAVSRPAEDAVLAAMWRNADYIPIDRFYGPHGGTVTVFQRRGNFAGWRPVFGITDAPGTENALKRSVGRVTYLQTFAARPIQARLHIQCAGTAGQTIGIFVNQRKAGDLAFAENASSSLDQEISLSAGTNDIVLRYSSDDPVTLWRLLVVPNIAAEG